MSEDTKPNRRDFIKAAAAGTAVLSFAERAEAQRQPKPVEAQLEVGGDAKNYPGVAVIGLKEYENVGNKPAGLAKAVENAGFGTVIVDNFAKETAADIIKTVTKASTAKYGTEILVKVDVTGKTADKLQTEANQALKSGAHGVIFSGLDNVLNDPKATVDAVAALIPTLKTNKKTAAQFGLERGFSNPATAEQGVPNMIVAKLAKIAPEVLPNLTIVAANYATNPETGEIGNPDWTKQNVDKLVEATGLKGDNKPRVISYQTVLKGKEADKDYLNEVSAAQTAYADSGVGVRTVEPAKIIQNQAPLPEIAKAKTR